MPPPEDLAANTAATPCGPRPMMPAKMISDTPFPMPYSVINSPNHISITVPAVCTSTLCRRRHQSSQGGLAGAGRRHVGEEPERNKESTREQDLVAELREPDRVDQRF